MFSKINLQTLNEFVSEELDQPAKDLKEQLSMLL